MMNNTKQVSLRNGANFSHIRKASQGDKLGGITYQNGNWHDTIFSAFKEEMLKELRAAKTREEKQAIVDKYNNQQSIYAKLRPKFPDLSKVLFDEAVKEYLNLINSDFGFLNQHGINNGVNTGRYKKEGTTNRIGKDVPDNWESEGLWAGQTLDRTTLGYEGDWDENSDLFKSWQSILNELGMETFLDEDKAYKLRLKEEPVPVPGTPPEKEKRKTYKVVDDYVKNNPRKLINIPTFPLYNAALLGVANATNRKVLDTQLKTPVMRYEAPTLQGKVTDAYSERANNEQALLEYNWNVKLQIDNSSDLQSRNKAERDLRAQWLSKLFLNNRAKQNVFNQTSLNLQQNSNTNKQNWANAANLNRQSFVADAQRRANAVAQYQAQLGQNLQENIMSNYTDWKAWNRNNMLQNYADWRTNEFAKVQQDLDKAYSNWQDAQKLENYQGYKDFWEGIIDKNTGNPIDDQGFGRDYASYLQKLGALDNETLRLRFFTDNLNNAAYKDQLAGFKEGRNKWLSDAQDTYLKDTKLINTRWGLTDSRNKPVNFDGEIGEHLYNYLNPRSSYESIYSYAKGGRFLEYLKHNRRAEKDIRDATMKTMSESRKMLARDLDALDKESLLLLRAIFK